MTTTRIPRDFNKFLKLLLVHEVRFLLIGGYAVNAFGHIRNTVDIDIWIASDAANQSRVIQAVRVFGFVNIADDVLDDPRALLRMGTPPLRIKILKVIAGVDFEECWPRRVEMLADGLSIPMISLNDLKTNKRAAARPKDLADLSGLP